MSPRKSILPTAVLIILMVLSLSLSAQSPSSENGVAVPTRGMIRFLVVFAEVDYGNNTANAIWPKGQVPTDAGTYFDHAPSSTPSGIITDYYYQMSFGAYRVLGDYYPNIVTIPDIGSSNDKLRAVIADLHSNSPVITQNGYTIGQFDSWGVAVAGLPKPSGANDRADIFFVIWRNHNPFTNQEDHGGLTGFTSSGFTAPLDTLTGLDAYGSMLAPNSGSGAIGIITHEYMHSLFGGNHWHTGGGNGTHTFQTTQGSFSMTAHSPAASNVASAWDRQHLGWRHPDKQFLISVGEGESEEETDITIENLPLGDTFVLRDSITTGDAIRIKLPHVNWTQLGDKKNQYLWLENRRQISSFDINSPDHDAEVNPGFGCHKKWTPGIYAYVQVGKDARGQDLNGDSIVDSTEENIYTSSFSHPNGLASFLFPLSAEGQHDFFWSLDEVSPPAPGEFCQYNNISIPVDQTLSLPNPFTGHSELFWQLETDSIDVDNPGNNTPTLIPFGNGIQASGELSPLILSEFVDGAVVRELPSFGDAEDAFSFANGRVKLSISTNPAPVPLYTHRSGSALSSPNLTKPTGGPGDFENRRIWLNGLSVEITGEDIDAEGAVELRIRWDDTRVTNDVRWCGDIVLENDASDPLGRQAEIRLAEGKNLYLDRGLSPTQYVAHTASETVSPSGNETIYPPGLSDETGRLFTDPTTLTISDGTRLHLERDATLWVQNGSRLEVENGAELILDPGARILEGSGGGEIFIYGFDMSMVIFDDISEDAGIDNNLHRSVSAVLSNFDDIRPSAGHTVHKDLFVCNAGVEVDEQSVNAWYDIDRVAGTDDFTLTRRHFAGNPFLAFDGADIFVTSHALVYDFDRDGFDDIIVFNQSIIQVGGGAATNVFFRNLAADGNGVRFEKVSEPPDQQSGFLTKGSVTRGSALANIDNDEGLDELFIANINTVADDPDNAFFEGEVKVYRNNDFASFPLFTDITDEVIKKEDNTPARGIIIEDTNDDGTPEIWVNAGPTIRVLEKETSGLFEFGGISFSGGGGFDMADINGDGKIDFTAGGKIFLNEGRLVFTEVATITGPEGTTVNGLKFFRYDTDNRKDIFITTSEGVSAVYRNLSNHDSVQFALADIIVGSATAVAIGDINGDHKDDIYQCDVAGGTANRLLLNRAPGTFFYVFTLVGGYDRFGEGFSSGPSIGSRVSLYEAGHAGDDLFLVGTHRISLTGSEQASADNLRAVFAFSDNDPYDVVVRFPSGRTRVLEGVTAGEHIVEELPADFELDALADAHVRADLAARQNDNYGMQHFLLVGTNRAEEADGMRALVNFDLSAVPPITVRNAILEMTVHGFDGGTPTSEYTLDVHRVVESGALTPWAEGNGFEGAGGPPGSTDPDSASGVAWEGIDANNQDQPAFDPTVEASVTVEQASATSGHVILWDLTSLVQGWIDGSIENHGILLRDATTDGTFRGLRLGSREGLLFGLPGAVAGPRLVIEVDGVLKNLFIRGDANGDGRINIADPSFVANFVFGIAPATPPPCRAAANANADLSINIADVSFIANFYFGVAPATEPSAPYPYCAVSVNDPFPCDVSTGCVD